MKRSEVEEYLMQKVEVTLADGSQLLGVLHRGRDIFARKHIRFKNPLFIAQMILAVLTPILAYAGLTVKDLTTWQALGDLLIGALSNPYVLGLVVVSVFNAVTDPTTSGVADSEQALTYTKPK